MRQPATLWASKTAGIGPSRNMKVLRDVYDFRVDLAHGDWNF